MQQNDVLAYARQQANVLETEMSWQQGDYGGWWKATPDEAYSRIVSRAVGALDFLRQFAGEESFWTHRAIAMYESKGDNKSTESGARNLGEIWRGWADQVEAGITEIHGARARAEVDVASTDLMTQVRTLLEGKDAHPAAAIVLCGAALEIALRAIVETRT
ncbi:hypothetical protein [Kitasatospora herbaricolor]|uniref:hypothetical protein n=1 Tax=Kitasatospora herbaricolor TaxID=68217 RepID=UPI0036DBAF03